MKLKSRVRYEWCPGGGWPKKIGPPVDVVGHVERSDDKNKPAPKVRCKVCSVQFRARTRLCCDGMCGVQHSVPPHKRKVKMTDDKA